LADGDTDLYISSAKFHEQFAADVPAGIAALMAATQRPITEAALNEPSGAASWKILPTYVIYGSADRNIPTAVMKFMADRAGARATKIVRGGSHALMVSHPKDVAKFIEAAVADRIASAR
jgi:pimeloyl-ACP methyl ester carboxylesterase